ncbi:MAG: hypothetical protein R3D28_02195 [Geminicoccaceae bacterium]
MTIGDVVLLNTFIWRLYQPLNFLGVIYREIRQSVTDLEQIEALLRLGRKVATQPTPCRSSSPTAPSASQSATSPTTRGSRWSTASTSP